MLWPEFGKLVVRRDVELCPPLSLLKLSSQHLSLKKMLVESRESSRKLKCLVEEGMLEDGFEAAWKIVGGLVAWGDEKGRGSVGRAGGGRARGKQLGKKPSSQETKMLLLVLSFLDKRFLSI